VRPSPPDELRHLTRRQFVGGAAAVGASSGLVASARWASASPHRVGLPSPEQVRRDFQRMVDFGPRLTGSAAHSRYISWLEREFTRAGLHLARDETYTTDRWLADLARRIDKVPAAELRQGDPTLGQGA
jgi:hypothetical protein